jgi:broad specificity phosphatase PhoE
VLPEISILPGDPIPDDGKIVSDREGKLRAHPWVRFRKSATDGDSYLFTQSFAVVRHADRLDHTDAWRDSPDRHRYPNDTPLTAGGHDNAIRAAKELQQSGTKFSLIVASPYLRCAQTAARIAQVLDLPIHFDLDLGEIFDNESMPGDINGKPQHRPPGELEAYLSPTFPDVKYHRHEGEIKIEGKLQQFPEAFKLARMRYCYKVKKLLQKATSELMSIIIVTHGDAVAAVTTLLREQWQLMKVPYTAYVFCTREVPVFDRTTGTDITDLPIFVDPDMRLGDTSCFSVLTLFCIASLHCSG